MRSEYLRNCNRCGIDFRFYDRERICPQCRGPREARKPANRALTFREKQVVHLICKAKLNKEIAYELHLTEGTIKEYLHRIFRKAGASNRTELAVWALKQIPDVAVAMANSPYSPEVPVQAEVL
jgi:DNA-binding CsgD family transcriptional regulator